MGCGCTLKNPTRNEMIRAVDLRPGDTIQLEDLGRLHVIEGPFRSARGIRFVDLYGNGIMLKPNEAVRLVSRENPAKKGRPMSRMIVRTNPTPAPAAGSRRRQSLVMPVPVEELRKGDMILLPNGGIQRITSVKRMSVGRGKDAKAFVRVMAGKAKYNVPFGVAAPVVRPLAGRAVVLSNPSSGALMDLYERCVQDVKAAGTAYNPWAVCTRTMQRAHGAPFTKALRARRRQIARERRAGLRPPIRRRRRRATTTATRRRRRSLTAAAARRRRLSTRTRARRTVRRNPSSGRTRKNPVLALTQGRKIGPGHIVIEHVVPAKGKWTQVKEDRHPPRKPGPHLVAPGAQMLMWVDDGELHFQLVKATFIKHHKKWRFLRKSGPVVKGAMHVETRALRFHSKKLPAGYESMAKRLAHKGHAGLRREA